MNCPFCDEPIDEPSAQVCPHCDQGLELAPASPYLESISFLGEGFAKIANGSCTPAEAIQLFKRWMGSVQRVLNLANEDLSAQLKIVRNRPEVDSLGIVQRFSAIQDDITEHLDRMAKLFGQANTAQDFERLLPELETSFDVLRSRVVDLEQFEAVEFEEAIPLPPAVSSSLDFLESVMGGLADYTESQDPDLLDSIIENLDAARELLDSVRRQALPC
jgi:hypothetical protein